jgi:hypothetical protein
LEHQQGSGIDLATVVGFILAHVPHSAHEAFFRAVNPSFGLGFGQKPFILDETFIADEDIIFLDAGHWLLLGSVFASTLAESPDIILERLLPTRTCIMESILLQCHLIVNMEREVF